VCRRPAARVRTGQLRRCGAARTVQDLRVADRSRGEGDETQSQFDQCLLQEDEGFTNHLLIKIGGSSVLLGGSENELFVGALSGWSSQRGVSLKYTLPFFFPLGGGRVRKGLGGGCECDPKPPSCGQQPPGSFPPAPAKAPSGRAGAVQTSTETQGAQLETPGTAVSPAAASRNPAGSRARRGAGQFADQSPAAAASAGAAQVLARPGIEVLLSTSFSPALRRRGLARPITPPAGHQDRGCYAPLRSQPRPRSREVRVQPWGLACLGASGGHRIIEPSNHQGGKRPLRSRHQDASNVRVSQPWLPHSSSKPSFTQAGSERSSRTRDLASSRPRALGLLLHPSCPDCQRFNCGQSLVCKAVNFAEPPILEVLETHPATWIPPYSPVTHTGTLSLPCGVLSLYEQKETVLGGRSPVLQPGCPTRFHIPLTSRTCVQQPKSTSPGTAGTRDMAQKPGSQLGTEVEPGIRAPGTGPHSSAAS